jgi:hypothetical protein
MPFWPLLYQGIECSKEYVKRLQKKLTNENKGSRVLIVILECPPGAVCAAGSWKYVFVLGIILLAVTHGVIVLMYLFNSFLYCDEM